MSLQATHTQLGLAMPVTPPVAPPQAVTPPLQDAAPKWSQRMQRSPGVPSQQATFKLIIRLTRFASRFALFLPTCPPSHAVAPPPPLRPPANAISSVTRLVALVLPFDTVHTFVYSSPPLQGCVFVIKCQQPWPHCLGYKAMYDRLLLLSFLGAACHEGGVGEGCSHAWG